MMLTWEVTELRRTVQIVKAGYCNERSVQKSAVDDIGDVEQYTTCVNLDKSKTLDEICLESEFVYRLVLSLDLWLY